jgi:hypothetical protein
MILYHNTIKTSKRYKKEQQRERAELYMEETPITLKRPCRQSGIERMAKVRRTLSRKGWACDSYPGSGY